MINLRPYQQPAVHALAKCDLGYIKAPAGSGKTVMVASALAQKESQFDPTGRAPMRVLWIAYTRELLAQGEAACKACGVQSEVNYKCMQGLSESDLLSYNIVIIDECHHVWAKESRTVLRGTLLKTDSGAIVRKYHNREPMRRCIVWGMSATPERENKEEDITPIIGPCVYEVPPEAVAEAGGVLPAIVRVVEFNDPTVAGAVKSEANKEIRAWMNDEQRSRVVWRHVLRIGVTENRARLERIAEVANREIRAGQSVIVLVDSVTQANALAGMIQNSEPLHGKLAKKRREGVSEAFKVGVCKCVISVDLLNEGFDAPIAGVLILARAGKAAGKLEQRCGRILRPYPGQAAGVVYDVCDKSHGMLAAQFWKRMSLYKRWGFRIEK